MLKCTHACPKDVLEYRCLASHVDVKSLFFGLRCSAPFCNQVAPANGNAPTQGDPTSREVSRGISVIPKMFWSTGVLHLMLMSKVCSLD